MTNDDHSRPSPPSANAGASWRFWGGHACRLLFAWTIFVVSYAFVEPTLSVAYQWLIPRTASASMPVDRAENGRVEGAKCQSLEEPANLQDNFDLLEREVVVDLRRDQSSIRRSAWLDACGKRLAQLHETLTSREFNQEAAIERARISLFGTVYSDGFESPRFSAPRVVDQSADAALVKVVDEGTLGKSAEARAGVSSRLTIYPGHWRSESTKVTLRVDPGTSLWMEPGATPVSQANGTVEWRLRDSEGPPSVHVFPKRVETSREASTLPRADRNEPLLVNALSGRSQVLRPAWLGMTFALPFLLMLWWATRFREELDPADCELNEALAMGCRAALALVAVLVVVEMTDRISDIRTDVLRERYGLLNLSWAGSVAKGCMLALAWPMVSGGRVVGREARGAVWSATIAAGLLACLVAAMSLDGLDLPRLTELVPHRDLATLRVPGERDGWAGRAFMLGVLLMAILLSAWAVARELAHRGLGVALVLVLGTVAFQWLERDRWTAFSSVAALPFGWAFFSASRRWFVGAIPSYSFLGGRKFLLLGSALAAILALPPDYTGNWGAASLLSSAAWALVRFWQVPALILLFTWLARRSAAQVAGHGPALRSAGMVLLFVFFYWRPQLPWVPLLVTAVVGMALAQNWVFAIRPLRDPRGRVGPLNRALRGIGASNRLGRLHRSLLKGLNAKLEKGEIGAPDVMAQTREMDQLVEQDAEVVARRRSFAMLALNAGPREPAWRRGWKGALLSTVIGLPWIVGYLGEGSSAPTNAELLSRLGRILLDVCAWPVLGFFFMYFYPRLRGTSGMQKGLVLALALIVPSLASTVMGNAHSADAWQALIFWSLQTFIACMSIGVFMGDLGALRRLGKGPTGLVEIYNLGTLTAWSSSLAIAIGAAVTTAMASQAGTLFSAGLKLLLPLTPVPPPQ